jgi:hypothetical protein
MSLFHRSVFLLIFTSFFLSLFLLIEGFFFSSTIEQKSEDIHMEKSRILDDATLYEQKVAQDILVDTIKKETQKKEKIQAFLQKKAQEKKTSTPKQDKKPPTKSYEFFYYPDDLSLEIQSQSEILQYFLSLDFIASKLSFLRVEFFSKSIDVRGKMKDASIKLFSLLDMKSPELLSVFIHEF